MDCCSEVQGDRVGLRSMLDPWMLPHHRRYAFGTSIGTLVPFLILRLPCSGLIHDLRFRRKIKDVLYLITDVGLREVVRHRIEAANRVLLYVFLRVFIPEAY